MTTKAIEGHSYLQRGNKEYNSKQYKKAVELYTSAIKCYSELDQNDSVKKSIEAAKINLSLSWNKIGQEDILTLNGHTKAIEAFEKSVEANPKYYDAHFNLGLAHEKNNNPEKAVAAFKDSLNLLPKGDISKENIDNTIENHCKIVECVQKLKNPTNTHNVLKEAFEYISTVDTKTANKTQLNFLTEQYGKSCINGNNKEIDQVENFYQKVNPGTTLASTLINDMYAQYKASKSESLIDNLLKQLGYLGQNDKAAGVLDGVKEAAGVLAIQKPAHQELVDGIVSAATPSELAEVLGATADAHTA